MSLCIVCLNSDGDVIVDNGFPFHRKCISSPIDTKVSLNARITSDIHKRLRSRVNIRLRLTVTHQSPSDVSETSTTPTTCSSTESTFSSSSSPIDLTGGLTPTPVDMDVDSSESPWDDAQPSETVLTWYVDLMSSESPGCEVPGNPATMQDAYSDLSLVEKCLEPSFRSSSRHTPLVRFFVAKLLLDPETLPHIDRNGLREWWRS
jgi:hypothetical protein